LFTQSRIGYMREKKGQQKLLVSKKCDRFQLV